MPLLKAEKTQDQVLVAGSIDGVLSKSQPFGWSKKVRTMRRDPTLAFVRDILSAPILASPWTVVTDDPKYKSAEEDILQNFEPKRFDFMQNAIRGLLDFGWQGYETVWAYNEQTGLVELAKLKPLLQDITDILVNEYGELRGLRNRPVYLNALVPFLAARSGPWVDLNRDESFVAYRDAEGTNWYGEPMMRRAEIPYDSWLECEKAAKRFDTKIAGAHWVVYYPIGHSAYKGSEQVNNYLIAVDILNSLESSGKIAVPQKILQNIEELNDGIGADKQAWKIELITVSSTSEGSFVGRQKYLDSLKSRSLGIPERAALEGQFGTKAEAEAHADFAIDNIEMFQVNIINQLNQWPVNFLLEVNHGREFMGHVKLQAAPLSDTKRAQLRAFYMAYLNTQQGSTEEAVAVDIPAIRDELGIPSRNENAHPTPDELKHTPPKGQPGEQNGDTAAVAALGEYTTLGQRDFNNNMKRMRSILAEFSEGTMSRVFAEQALSAIGVSPGRTAALLDDAAAGELEPEEITAPIVE